MSSPRGDINTPGAKIHAFKHHLGNQPIDPNTQQLLPLKVGKFFETSQIDDAVRLGTEAVGWVYSGHQFQATERYMGLYHEVAPADQALSCAQCHENGALLNFAQLGYTPKTTYEGKPLCASCHEDESGEWSELEFFYRVHDKHLEDYSCITCHFFSR